MANAWWACYGRDYAAKTGHLTMLQHGAYFTLLNTYYTSGGPLPEKVEHLVRICGAHSTEEIEAISFVLNSFFSLRSDGWHNKRADAEIREVKRISTLRRKARLGKRKTIDTTNDNQLHRQSHTHTQKEEPKTKAASAFQMPDWVPKEEWQAFDEMRRKIRKPMTPKACALIVTELHKLRTKGHSPKLVLEQSIRNGWQDVYELKGDSHGTGRENHQTRQPSAQVARFQNNIAEIQRTFGDAAMGVAAGADGAGQTPRLGPGDSRLLEGEVKPLRR